MSRFMSKDLIFQNHELGKQNVASMRTTDFWKLSAYLKDLDTLFFKKQTRKFCWQEKHIEEHLHVLNKPG